MRTGKLEYSHFVFQAMGSPCDIQLYAKTQAQAQHIAKSVISDVQRLEACYSRYRSGSLLSKINQLAAIGGRISVNEETTSLLNYAATCYEQSNGLFDISSGVLRRAWRFSSNSLPDPQQIETLLDKVGWHKLHWSPPVLEFPISGMELDFGGIVKEYAVDRAAALCWQAGVRHGVINLGGDIKVIGPRADGSAWRIGIRHPRNKETVLQTILLHEGALASSGDYERCMVVDGVSYGHVLNPLTGWPVRYMAAVSVLADFCVIAGSASTIAMLKEDSGSLWLKELGLPHLWVNVHGEAGGSISVF